MKLIAHVTLMFSLKRENLGVVQQLLQVQARILSRGGITKRQKSSP